MLGIRKQATDAEFRGSTGVLTANTPDPGFRTSARAHGPRMQGVCNGLPGNLQRPNGVLSDERWRSNRQLLAYSTVFRANIRRGARDESNGRLTPEGRSQGGRTSDPCCNKGHIYGRYTSQLMCSVNTGQPVAKSVGECDSAGPVIPLASRARPRCRRGFHRWFEIDGGRPRSTRPSRARHRPWQPGSESTAGCRECEERRYRRSSGTCIGSREGARSGRRPRPRERTSHGNGRGSG